jgi:hypothetical protein
MAAVVWSTLEVYKIQNKVSDIYIYSCVKLLAEDCAKIIAIMMDNASNNDTMMKCIETRCCGAGIEFHADQARMRCMPHTIHLAAIKVRFITLLMS